MAGNVNMCWFDHISDDVLLHILCFVPKSSWKHIRHVCKRFRNVSADKELVRFSNLSCAYGMSETDFQDYLRTNNAFIEKLNLNHCHWLSSTTLSNFIPRCKKIRELFLLDCKLTTKGLSKILCSLECLTALVISVPDLLEFSNELNSNSDVQFALRNLKHFGLHVKEETNWSIPHSLQFHLSQQTTIIEYCPDLESFCVIGHPGSSQKVSKRLIHPLIVKTQNMSKLKTMSINSTNDATSRLYFFGVLVKAFEAGVHFENLSVSGLDLKQAVKKSYFIRSMKESCPTLENLDLSKVHIDELEASLKIDDAPRLKYLNLSDVRSGSKCIGLMNIACRFPNLVSLSIRGATSGYRYWKKEELSNFDQLLLNCPNLCHLNLSGVHVHDTNADKTLADIISKRKMKGLVSLALPVCCLVNSRSLERRHTTNYSISFGKRKRISKEQPVPSTSGATSDGEDGITDGELSRIYTACPNLTAFELINTGFNESVPFAHKNVYDPCAVSYKFSDPHILPVSRWKNLKYLQITGVPGIKMSKVLLEIAKNCVHLERLFLAYIGLVNNPAFWETLQNFKQLLDLRIEQPYMALQDKFFQSCLGCHNLQRLLIVSKGVKIVSKAVETFVQQASNLYMLQIYTDSTFKECYRLTSVLQKRYETLRPGFLAIIDKLHNEKPQSARSNVLDQTIPLQHLQEMTLLTSKVCSKPLHSIWGDV